eukprot:6757871-Pyramimonas_sp.AAC.1
MSWLVPSPALPKCITDALYQVQPDAVQTSLGYDEYHLKLFGVEPLQVQFSQLARYRAWVRAARAL